MSQSGTTRSKYIRDRVRSILGIEGDEPVSEDQIFSVATEKSRDIAEYFQCVESEMTLVTTPGTGTYDLTTLGGSLTGFYRLKLIKAPASTFILFAEVGIAEMNYLKRFARALSGIYRVFYSIWNGVLELYPVPSGADTYTISYFKSPTTVMSRTVAPETPSMFDTAIVYGTVAELCTQVGRQDLAQVYLPLYESEKVRGGEAYRARWTVPMSIAYQDF